MGKNRIVSWIPKEGEDWPAIQLEVGESILTIHYDVDGGRVRIKRISGDDLTWQIVRDANLGTFARGLAEALRDHPERLNWAALIYALSEQEGSFGVVWDSEEERKLYAAVYESTQAEMRLQRGPAAKNDDHYREVAQMYLIYVEKHGQRVIEAMTAEYRKRPGYFNLSKNTVKTWVRRARETHWLTKGTQGRAGAKQGPKLKKWLEEQGDES